MIDYPDPFWAMWRTLLARVDAIEARQRAYGQHDPGCPAFKEDKSLHSPMSAAFGPLFPMTAKLCNCWLSEPANSEESAQ